MARHMVSDQMFDFTSISWLLPRCISYSLPRSSVTRSLSTHIHLNSRERKRIKMHYIPSRDSSSFFSALGFPRADSGSAWMDCPSPSSSYAGLPQRRTKRASPNFQCTPSTGAGLNSGRKAKEDKENGGGQRISRDPREEKNVLDVI